MKARTLSKYSSIPNQLVSLICTEFKLDSDQRRDLTSCYPLFFEHLECLVQVFAKSGREHLPIGRVAKQNIKGCAEQAQILAQHFPSLRPSTLTLPKGGCPSYASGWFVFPKIEKLGKTNNHAIKQVLDRLASTTAWGASAPLLNQARIELRHHTYYALETVSKQSKGDFIVLPGHCGERYRGSDADTVRVNFRSNEFALPAAQCLCILLSHPEMLEKASGWLMAGDKVEAGKITRPAQALFVDWYCSQGFQLFRSPLDWKHNETTLCPTGFVV